MKNLTLTNRNAFSSLGGSIALCAHLALAAMALSSAATPAAAKPCRTPCPFSLLYTFTGGTDGVHPNDLIRDAAGNFYGTTADGGAGNVGTIFKIASNGAFTLLHTFTGPDGAGPSAALTRDAAGNLYGTAQEGGEYGSGTVFELDTFGNYTVLHTFTGGPTDGAQPTAGVTLDSAGILYGTTKYGGAAQMGVVYKLDPAQGLTILHSFDPNSDGATPYAGLTLGADGNFYGTTFAGGTYSHGMVYKIDPFGNFTDLWDLGATEDPCSGSPDGSCDESCAYESGAQPTASVIRLGANVYGTNSYGGSKGQYAGSSSQGTIFQLAYNAYQDLVSFSGDALGGGLYGSLATDAAGNLYGTTYLGGKGHGVVFRLDPFGILTALHTFSGGDGAHPQGGVIYATGPGRFDYLYGTTYYGGAHNVGVVFRQLDFVEPSLATKGAKKPPQQADKGHYAASRTVRARR